MKWPWNKPNKPPITTIVASCPNCGNTTVLMFHTVEGGLTAANAKLDEVMAAIPKRTAADIVKEKDKDAVERVNRRVYDQDHRAQPEV